MTGPTDAPGDSDEPLDFDPYRFGRPEHPVPPEFAPPGYRPPAPAWPPTDRSPAQGGMQAPQFPHYPPPPPPGWGSPGRSNSKAVWALVLGILAVLLSFLSLYDVVLIVPAIVLGALGRAEAGRRPDGTGRGMATAGLVCGIVAFVLAALATVWIYHRIQPCLDRYGTSGTGFQNCATHRLLGDS